MRAPGVIVAGVLAISLSLGASACGDPPTLADRPHETLDGLVRIDHGRLHLRCTGRGATTVLLLSGWDDSGDKWGAVESPVADNDARVCSYSRFGTGTSDPPPTTQTFATQAADLHSLLDAAGEPGPYVVVGHSFGGAEAVTFASAYADEVRALVLVDASPTTWPDTVCSVPAYAAGCALMRDPASDGERLDVFAAFAEVGAITSLGDLPMTVMTAAHRDRSGLAPAELDRLDAIWADGTRRWAALSSASTVETVEHTGHHIEVDQPRVVIDAVVDLLPSTAVTPGTGHRRSR